MKKNTLCMDYNQALNIHALLTDAKLRSKLEALKLFYSEMEQKNLRWTVYSSAALFMLGITPDFNDWDIITAPEDAEETFKTFNTLNALKYPEPPAEKSQYFNPPCKTFSVNGTDFDVSPEFSITTFGTNYMYRFNDRDIELITVDNIRIPICPAEAMFVMYYMMTGWQPNRRIKVEWLKEYLAEHLRHPSILIDASKQNIPHWIKEDIRKLIYY